MTRLCGLCRSEMADDQPLSADPDRCPCGARHITRYGSGVVLAHAEGCDGGDGCECEASFSQ
jgi:hypothetical protein